jgi:hypothetical protein
MALAIEKLAPIYANPIVRSDPGNVISVITVLTKALLALVKPATSRIIIATGKFGAKEKANVHTHPDTSPKTSIGFLPLVSEMCLIESIRIAQNKSGLTPAKRRI